MYIVMSIVHSLCFQSINQFNYLWFMVPFYSRLLPQYTRTWSGVTVNHKHLSPVQSKNECRLTLVIIKIP